MIGRLLLIMAFVGSWPSISIADMIDTEGMQPWEACALCHGLDGVSRMAKFPRLAGQPERYLIKQLEDFRTMRRHNDDRVMTDNAALLTPSEVAVVAKHFSSQTAPASVDPDNDDDAASGANIFHQGDTSRGIPACASCHVHGDKSEHYPHITAQHPDYIAKQLRDFKAARRINDPGKIMQTIAAKLSDQEISEIAAYAASKPRP